MKKLPDDLVAPYAVAPTYVFGTALLGLVILLVLRAMIP